MVRTLQVGACGLGGRGSGPEQGGGGRWMIRVSRGAERIGDHAGDIGERASYVVTGTFREFTDASEQRGEPMM